MFVASHKHEHLKGLIGQGGSLRLQDVKVTVNEITILCPTMAILILPAASFNCTVISIIYLFIYYS